MDICVRVEMLPKEIANIIKEYIPLITMIFIEKKKYILYHDYILHKIRKQEESYIRFIIRDDLDFVLLQILKKYHIKWINTKKYLYKDIIYYNYLSFILSFILENNSNKCKQLTNLFLEKQGISKNIYKNTTFINKRWKI